MPYRGERQETTTQSMVADWSQVKRLPGVLVPAQMGCSFLGFLLGVGGSMIWRAGAAHGIFIFFSFVACMSCVVYMALRILRIHQVLCRREEDLNWNYVGLVHSGVNCFLMMVGSCFIVDIASAARALKAAGVFGFLGFTGFLVQLAWEILAWRKTKEGRSGGLLPEYATASVHHGPDRPENLASRDELVEGEVALGDGERQEETVGFVSMKSRPLSSFMEPSSHGEITAPMLYAPGFKDTEARVHPAIEEEEGTVEAEEGEKGKKGGAAEKKRKGEGESDGMGAARTYSVDSSCTSSSSSSSQGGGDWQVPS